MSFNGEYLNIKKTVQKDLDFLEQSVADLFDEKNPLKKDLFDFLTLNAKRLRPVLGFLFLRCLFDEINPKQQDVLLAVELVHNATLIHDDIIDNAESRRNRETFNAKFDDSLAVVAGDFLLSVAMEKIILTGNVEAIKLCTSALKSTCLGEINQYFSKYNVTSIEDYIEKSKRKTALLFEVSVLGGLLTSEIEINEQLKQSASDFSQNFGIAFQIRDDLMNILNDGLSNSDIKSGIYTAPVIFAYQENENLFQEENIVEAIKNTQAIEKTKDLMDNYFSKSTSAIENAEDNEYKQAIYKLIELLRDYEKSTLTYAIR